MQVRVGFGCLHEYDHDHVVTVSAGCRISARQTWPHAADNLLCWSYLMMTLTLQMALAISDCAATSYLSAASAWVSDSVTSPLSGQARGRPHYTSSCLPTRFCVTSSAAWVWLVSIINCQQYICTSNCFNTTLPQQLLESPYVVFVGFSNYMPAAPPSFNAIFFSLF